MKNPEYGFKCARTSRPNLAAGNGLFGCRDGAPIFAGKATGSCRDKNPENG
jgi:hypothetical protein